MKYYTKEFYSLLNQCDLAEGLTISKETDFDRLYQRSLEKYIQDARKKFDTPLFSIHEDLDTEDQDAKEYAKIISSMFSKRGKFDAQEATEEFEDMYNLRLAHLNYPEQIIEMMDPGILALGYCTPAVQEILEAMQEANQLAVSNIVNQEESSRDAALQLLYDQFNFDEGILTELEINDLSIRMKIECYDENATVLNIQLDHARIIENEIDQIYNCVVEKVEFYRVSNYLEFHLMIFNGEYRYLTIQSDLIKINDLIFTERHTN